MATPLGFEPRITPPKGAVLPLHHGVRGFAILDWRFSIQAQRPKFQRDRPRQSNSLEKSRLNLRAVGRVCSSRRWVNGTLLWSARFSFSIIAFVSALMARRMSSAEMVPQWRTKSWTKDRATRLP